MADDSAARPARKTGAGAASGAKAPRSGAGKTQRGGAAASLTQRVYDLLRAEILSCELEPGRELSEAELAARFDVSKTPVREALATLRSEGFVKIYPRRGYQVAPVTFDDMNELFEVRTILEAGAAELACGRITEAELEQLRRLADVVYDRQEHPSLKRFIQANRDFHVAIAQASGNARLHLSTLRVIDELERFFYLGARLRDVSSETNRDHHLIVEALRARDAGAAAALMVRHNEVTRQGLIQQIALSRAPLRLSAEVSIRLA